MTLRNRAFCQFALLFLGVPMASGAVPMDLPLERASCEDRSGGRVDLALSLQSDQNPIDARNRDEGWSTRLVLEASSEVREGKLVAVWSFEDYIEKPVPFPPPFLTGKLLCGEYGAGRDLYALLFVWRVSPYVDWQEAWFFELRLPFNGLLGDKAVVTWEEYVPRLPLKKGQHLRDVEMLWERNTAVILLGGVAAPGSSVSPLIKADLPSEKLTFYPGNRASQLGVGHRRPPVAGQASTEQPD